MKKYLLTSLAMLSIALAFGQNYVSGSIGLYGPSYNAATTIPTGGQALVSTAGNWWFGGTVSKRAGTGSFTFNGTGTYSNALLTSYTDGVVNRTGSSVDFTFPVGDAGATVGGVYHPLLVSAASAALTTSVIYNASSTTPNPTLLGSGVGKVDPIANWGFTSAAANATVTLTTRDETGIFGAAGIYVAGFNTTLNVWEKLGTATPVTGAGQILVSNAGINLATYSAFTAAGDALGIIVNAKVYLQGATINGGGLMRADLNDGTALDMALAQPYNTTAFGNYNGGETVTSAFLAAHPTVVDWVFVELRSSSDFTTVVGKRAAFVTTNGTLIDINGNTGVSFPNATGSYYVSISHRNHMVVLTSNTLTLTPTSVQYDFTNGIGKAMDNGNGNQMVQVGGVWTMWAGDVNHDNIIDVADRSRVKTDVNAAYFDEYHIGDIYIDAICDTPDYSLMTLNAGFGIVSPLF